MLQVTLTLSQLVPKNVSQGKADHSTDSQTYRVLSSQVTSDNEDLTTDFQIDRTANSHVDRGHKFLHRIADVDKLVLGVST
jgi:hypothetical protein